MTMTGEDLEMLGAAPKDQLTPAQQFERRLLEEIDADNSTATDVGREFDEHGRKISEVIDRFTAAAEEAIKVALQRKAEYDQAKALYAAAHAHFTAIQEGFLENVRNIQEAERAIKELDKRLTDLLNELHEANIKQGEINLSIRQDAMALMQVMDNSVHTSDASLEQAYMIAGGEGSAVLGRETLERPVATVQADIESHRALRSRWETRLASLKTEAKTIATEYTAQREEIERLRQFVGEVRARTATSTFPLHILSPGAFGTNGSISSILEDVEGRD